MSTLGVVAMAALNAQNLNLYAYAGNAPVRARDPLGLQPLPPYRFWGWGFCPPAPPGYVSAGSQVTTQPAEACIPDETGQLVCDDVFAPGTCRVRCFYDCVAPKGRKDECPPLELPGRCFTSGPLRST